MRVILGETGVSDPVMSEEPCRSGFYTPEWKWPGAWRYTGPNGQGDVMPTKRMFDLVVITTLLMHPVIGAAKLSARRAAVEGTGVRKTVGTTLGVFL